MDLLKEDPAIAHAKTLARSTQLHEQWCASKGIGELGADAGREGSTALSRTILAGGFESSIRWRAAESVGELGESAGRDAAASLAQALLSRKPGEPGQDVFVRSCAAGSLGKLGDACYGQGAEALAKSLRYDVSEQVRRRAAIALGELGAEAAGEDGQASLARALRWDADENVRYRAAEALGKYGAQIKEAGVSGLLLSLAKDPDAGVRGNAATALGGLGPTASQAAVAGLFKARDTDFRDAVRAAATEAVRQLQVVCVETLRNASAHEFVRGNAAMILGELQEHAGKEALDALAVTLLRDETYVRRRAAEGLLKLGPKAGELAAAAVSRAAEEDEDVFVQWTTSQFLEAFGSTAASEAAANRHNVEALNAMLGLPPSAAEASEAASAPSAGPDEVAHKGGAAAAGHDEAAVTLGGAEALLCEDVVKQEPG